MFSTMLSKLFKWRFLLVFLSAPEFFTKAVPFIDNDCIFKVHSNHTYKFNLTRSTNEVPSEINAEVFDSDATIVLRICDKSGDNQCPSYLCLHYEKYNSFIDIGSSLHSAVYKDDNLKLHFIGQAKCNSTLNYSTTILYSCYPEDVAPRLDKYEDCNFFIVWISTIACPTKEVSVINNCVINTPSRSFDLRPLYRHSGYEYRSGNHDPLNDVIIKFGICGYLTSPCERDTYLCEVSKIYGNVLSTSYEYTVTVVNSEDVSITFFKSSGGKIVIMIECKNGLNRPILKFSHQNERKDLYFVLYTTIVCESPSSSCQIKEENEEDTYDLTELHKFSDNWLVTDKNGNKIIFNVCGNLNYEPGLPCAGGNVFACMKSHKNETFIIGTRQENVIVHKRGHLSFIYSGGINCEHNKLFLLNISLICNNTDSEPTLMKASPCRYLVQWYTSAACPVQFFKGSKCIINDINLNNLFSRNPYFVNTKANGSFLLNLCQPLKSKCAGENNVTVCWNDTLGHQHAIGYSGYEPVYSDGLVRFIIYGKPCNENETKSIIKFEIKCDYNGHKTKPVFINQSRNCVFNFIWFTDVVCNERSLTKCKVHDQIKSYDLSPLILSNSNYEIKLGSNIVYINICQSLVPGPKVGCRETTSAGACYVNKHSFEDIFLGVVSDPLQIVNNSLVLSYNTGEVCGKQDVSNYKTIIKFYCWPKANSTIPTFLNSYNCMYNFEWYTPYACPINKENDIVPTTIIPVHQGPDVTTTQSSLTVVTDIIEYENACITENSYNKYRFDLRSLMEKDWILDQHLTISICRPLHNSGCTRTSGSCLHSSDTFVNMGNANGNLRYKNGLLFLNYTGENCRSTIIYFICHEHSGHETVDDIDHCVTVIYWNTPLACQTNLRKLCCDKEAGILCHLKNNYFIDASNKSVNLNICKYANSQPELACNISECLGPKHFYMNTFAKKGGSPPLELQHIHGEICNGEVRRRYTTSLKLYCDRHSNADSPRFKSIGRGCVYNFEWPSSALCKSEISAISSANCNSLEGTYYLNVILNFQRAQRKIGISPSSASFYYFNFCNRTSVCKSDICVKRRKEWNEFANISYITSGGNPNVTVLQYTLNQEKYPVHCGAEVRLVCNTSAEEGEPIISFESLCIVEATWESKYACVEDIDVVSPNTEFPRSHAAALIFTTMFIIVSVACAFIIWRKWYYFKNLACKRCTYTQPASSFHTEINLMDLDEEDEEVIFKTHQA